jgi:hypothetical protein
VINVRNGKGRRAMLCRPPTAAKSQRHAREINAAKASRDDASATYAVPERQSHRSVANSTPNARSRVFVWDRNGVRRFAINAPAKQVAKVLPNGRSSAASLELELGRTRWRPATTLHTAMHLHDGLGEAAPRLRPKSETARERPSHDLRHSVVAQRMLV